MIQQVNDQANIPCSSDSQEKAKLDNNLQLVICISEIISQRDLLPTLEQKSTQTSENNINDIAQEPQDHAIRKEIQFKNNLINTNILPIQAQAVAIPTCQKQICIQSKINDNQKIVTSPFKNNISQQTRDDFDRILDYSKSSNNTIKYMVFREINVNAQPIKETSNKLKKSDDLERIVFSNFNNFQYTEKQQLLQSIIKNINYSEMSVLEEEFKKRLTQSNFYIALVIFAQKFQKLFRWNKFLQIFQYLIIQIVYMVGLIMYYKYNTEDNMKEFLIYLCMIVSFITEIFLIKRSGSFLEREGNDYFFIMAALIQTVSGLVAVQFVTERAPASVTTTAFVLFLLSYTAYILLITIKISQCLNSQRILSLFSQIQGLIEINNIKYYNLIYS